MNIKDLARITLNTLHLDLTKNLEYDRLTKKIMKQVIDKESNCIDVGCHKGEILDSILHLAPGGKHYAFEPIPDLQKDLQLRFSSKATIFPYALAEKNGNSTFQYVKNAPAYSGILKRRYDVKNPDIEEIEVELKMLDEILPAGTRIDFIKIDVEGAELGVLRGAKRLISENKPVVIYENGLGASDYYGTKPEDLYNFFTDEIGMKVSTLSSYISNKEPLSLFEYKDLYNNSKEYYFIAYK